MANSPSSCTINGRPRAQRGQSAPDDLRTVIDADGYSHYEQLAASGVPHSLQPEWDVGIIAIPGTPHSLQDVSTVTSLRTQADSASQQSNQDSEDDTIDHLNNFGEIVTRLVSENSLYEIGSQFDDSEEGSTARGKQLHCP